MEPKRKNKEETERPIHPVPEVPVEPGEHPQIEPKVPEIIPQEIPQPESIPEPEGPTIEPEL